MTVAPAPPGPRVPEKKSPGVWRRLGRLHYWITILAGVWTLVLILRRAPTPQIAVSPQAARSAEGKLQELTAPPPASAAGEAQKIALTEEELNSYLASHLDLNAGGDASGSDPSIEKLKSSVRDVKVSLEGDRARAYVVFNLAGKDLTLQLEGRLHVVGGYLRFEPTSGSLGDFNLPQTALDTAVGRLFDSPENRKQFRVPQGIRDIRVENGQLVIERQ
jgi:hypothetical protein